MASRVLPIPPGPVSVTSRAAPTACRTRASSARRPTNSVSSPRRRPVEASKAMSPLLQQR